MRLLNFDYRSGDYKYFLQAWYGEFRANGGILSLGKEIGNYTPLYTFFLTVLSYLPEFFYLAGIKLLSCLFDFVTAYFAAKIIAIYSREKAVWAFTIVLLIPTVILNGSVWGQCDSVYTGVILIAVYFLMRGRGRRDELLAVLFLSVAFSLKLQTIFILPLFAYYLFIHKTRWYTYFLIPLVYAGTCLPALLLGRSVSSLLGIYLGQTQEYETLTLGYPNFYTLVEDLLAASKTAVLAGSLFTVSSILAITLWAAYRNRKPSFGFALQLAFFEAMYINYFLPGMHERYGFLADIFSVIYAIYRKDRIPVALTLLVCSGVTYMQYLLFIPKEPSIACAILRLLCLAVVGYDLVWHRGARRLEGNE